MRYFRGAKGDDWATRVRPMIDAAGTLRVPSGRPPSGARVCPLSPFAPRTSLFFLLHARERPGNALLSRSERRRSGYPRAADD